MLHELNHHEHLNSADNPIWMDFLRFLLGAFLFIKGYYYLEYTSDVLYVFSSSHNLILLKKTTHITGLIQMIGGIMIAVGFLTRFALLCQFPILIGAILVINLRHSNSTQVNNGELWHTLIVLCLLLFFMVAGPGRFSVDNKILRQKTPDNTP